ncbi:hypothetical protein [Reyranella sp. CPCC 100927]|uniref:hypothetical protein n=1 Tax=Reyranella sp. CPCC 100927 TaxID=2599616 RepID=UPI0011B51A19|nr:hypothetical protein [Reyranella sp. CPCC 100927]TWS95123.1 hypothetical protein FQU96_40490 [Reyranella sp. CPCC 100927]
MADLTPDERKEALQAFSKGMTLPLAVTVIPATLLNLLGPRTIVVPIASLIMIVGGMAVALALGLHRRREVLAAIAARKRPPTNP